MDVTTTAYTRYGVSGLASLPQVLLKLLELYDDGDAPPRELARIIARDSAISAKTLALGRAVDAQGRRGDGITLKQAIASLGPDMIKSIVIGASGHPILLRYAEPWRAPLQKLWLRSLTCAHLAELLAELAEYPAPHEAYLGGLFHNIGQLELGGYAPDQYPNLLAVAQDGPKLVQLELGHFGTQHYDVGAELIESWRLQSFIADAVRYQGEPADKLRDAHPLVRIVNVARGLASGEASRPAAIEAALEFFPHLQATRLRSLARQAVDRVAEDAHELEVPLEGEAAAPATEDKAFELARRIRNVAILDGISHPLTAERGPAMLEMVVRCGAEVLAGAQSSLLLIYNAGHDALEGVGTGLAGEIHLPVGTGASVAARALSSGTMLPSTEAEADDALVVADRQLLKLLNTPAMLCVPLVNGDVSAGVFALGVARDDLPYPKEQMALLAQFGARIAAAVPSRHEPAIEPHAPNGGGDVFFQHVRQSVHEARNPLTTVQNYVQILSSKHAGEAWAERDLKIISEEIERIDGILRRLSDITIVPKGAAGAVAINRVLTDMVWLHQTSTLDARNIGVQLDLGQDIPPLPVDPDGLKQVISNLLNNAVEAMPEGGEIQIRTRAGINVNGQMYAQMEIRDSGRGVSPGLVDMVFKSGASDKGEGRGLGLAIVAELIEEWGGSISCQSEPGAGTVFDVLLPYRHDDKEHRESL
ncbi:MAG TPA: HDOD domain-containing protein [Gammaproteobacteria bacterium]|nr:HDOD domain-containing protein [Gammaproteobacteria bacterium]